MSKRFFAAIAILAILAACSQGTESVTGSSPLKGAATTSWDRPECLEQQSSGGADVLVKCGTDEIFTYLVAPEITVNFSRKGFDVTPYIMYGPAVNVEGVELVFSPHPRAGSGTKTVILGSGGGFAKRDSKYIYVSARSFVTDQQGHKFYSEYSGVKYK